MRVVPLWVPVTEYRRCFASRIGEEEIYLLKNTTKKAYENLHRIRSFCEEESLLVLTVYCCDEEQENQSIKGIRNPVILILPDYKLWPLFLFIFKSF